MLVTTSLVYVILTGSKSIATLYIWMELYAPLNCETWLLRQYALVVKQLSDLIYAYNFYVYVITGRQFRTDLVTLFCSCRFPGVNAANDDEENDFPDTRTRRRQIDSRV